MKYNIRILIEIILLLGIAQAETPKHDDHDAPPKQLQIYLLIGQSNMAGRAPITNSEQAAPPRTYLLNAENEWEPASHPFNQYSTIRKELSLQKLNPGYAFAKTMSGVAPGTSIGLIVNACGGTSIKQWEKDTRFYQEALKRTLIAKKSGQLRGILWHQGESDEKDADYLSKLEKLIKDLRSDLNAPELPFIAGQVNHVPLINDQIAKLPDRVPFTRFTSSEGLKASDRWHFDTASMNLLGQRYAEAMIELQKEAAKRSR